MFIEQADVQYMYKMYNNKAVRQMRECHCWNADLTLRVFFFFKNIEFHSFSHIGNDIGLEYPISSLTDTARMGDKCHVINFDDENICIKFKTKADAQKLRLVLENIRRLHPKSVFSERTEESSASQYFQFYGYLSQQQNMMQDYVRTSTYQKAILSNISDFQVSFAVI